MQKANIVFMGTPEIAVPTLEKLNELHKLYKNYVNEFKHIIDKVIL